MADSSRFPVYVDEEAFTEDLEHATPAGRVVAFRERARLERKGIAPSELRACQPEGRYPGAGLLSTCKGRRSTLNVLAGSLDRVAADQCEALGLSRPW